MAILFLLLSLFVADPQIKPMPGPQLPAPAYVLEGYDNVTNVYQLVFLANELLDPREVRYVFSRPAEFMNDWNMMQRRIKSLEGSPYLWESARFPDRSVVNELLMFNRAFKNHAEACKSLWRNKFWIETYDENEELYKIWDYVRDAKCEYYYIHIRREALRKLKVALDNIDPTWYDKGMMPPHVPYWRFTHIR